MPPSFLRHASGQFHVFLQWEKIMIRLRNIFGRALLTLGIFAGLGFVFTANAVAGNTTFYWSATCLDCSAIGNGASTKIFATLTLKDYVLGDPIVGDYPSNPTPVGVPNFVSFVYGGSNLVNPYTVYDDSTLPNRDLNEYPASEVSGQINTDPGASNFAVEFDDGLFFRTSSDGAWSTCAPGVDGYYTVPSVCFPTAPADFGNAAVFTTAVPEPGAWAMLVGGLGLVAFMRRRRKASAAH